MGKTVLIVDDSNTVIMSLKTTLEMNGFDVETANDGLQALNKLKSGIKPNLIISDLNMPNMGGIEFIKNARAISGLRFIPILVLTTESQQAKRLEAKKAGATGWLVKPIAGPDLINVIKQVLPGV